MRQWKAKKTGFYDSKLIADGEVFFAKDDMNFTWAEPVEGGRPDVAPPAAPSAPAADTMAGLQNLKATEAQRALEAANAANAELTAKLIEKTAIADTALARVNELENTAPADEAPNLKQLKADLKIAKARVEELTAENAAKDAEIDEISKVNADWKVSYDELQAAYDALKTGAPHASPPNEPG